jgi:hypothetical protein
LQLVCISVTSVISVAVHFLLQQHVLPGTNVKQTQRHRIFFKIKRRRSQNRATASTSSSGKSSSSSGDESDASMDAAAGSSGSDAAAAGGGAAIVVSAYEVLVDSEAMQRLSSQLQPGRTIGLKTQVGIDPGGGGPYKLVDQQLATDPSPAAMA